MKTKVRKTARHKVMDLIARRDHSELELRRKLANAEYSAEEIEDAIAYARQNRWLAPPEELAKRVAARLDSKRKGHRYIELFLRSKGLPSIEKDTENEISKGRALVLSKIGAQLRESLDSGAQIDYESRKKIHRLLANRGFDDETIRQVIDSLKE